MPGRVHVELKQGMVGVLGLLIGVGLSLAWSAEGAAQTQVRVLAETRIDLAAERAGASVLVLGVLRDDLGQALPHREVQVATRPADSADSAAAPPGVFGTQLVSTAASSPSPSSGPQAPSSSRAPSRGTTTTSPRPSSALSTPPWRTSGCASIWM